MEPFLLGPGKHRIPAHEYHRDPCVRPSLSSHIASMMVNRSPRHAYHAHPRLGNGAVREYTEATARGTAIDSFLLGGDTEVVPLDVPDFKTKAARAARDEALAAGKLPMKLDEYKAHTWKASAIRARLEGHGVSLDGENQVTIVWEEPSPSGPVLCRARLDHVKVRDERIVFYDLKTIYSCHPRDVAAQMVKFGYDIQYTAYKRALGAIYPHLVGRIEGIFLFVETEAPFAVLPAEPDGSMQKRGELGWGKAVALWGECLKTGEWPEYVGRGEVARIAAPAWAQPEMPEGGSPNVPF